MKLTHRVEKGDDDLDHVRVILEKEKVAANGQGRAIDVLVHIVQLLLDQTLRKREKK
jgi:hypothetical protein